MNSILFALVGLVACSFVVLADSPGIAGLEIFDTRMMLSGHPSPMGIVPRNDNLFRRQTCAVGYGRCSMALRCNMVYRSRLS